MRHLVVISILGLGAGCAPLLGTTRDPAYDGNGPGAISLPGFVAYQNSVGPLSYRATANAAAAAPRDAHGEACQTGLYLPIGLVWAIIKSEGNAAYAAASVSAGWGQGGYAEAVAQALEATPGGRLVDVRADMATTMILSVWRRQCVRVTGRIVPAS